jgi:osmotically-inducible protein OsmY
MATSVRAVIICLSALTLLGVATGCASTRYTQSKSELSEDTATSAEISAALTNDTQGAYFEGVRVETFKGIVQLSGFVNTGALKNRAGDIAREAAGGREVKNSIAVKQ